MTHIYDYIFEPIRKVAFRLQAEKSKRWYSHTNQFTTFNLNANQYLYDVLQTETPLMISRLGTSELHIILNYLLRSQPFFKRTINYFKGIYPEFWWGRYALNDLSRNSGFFPSTPKNLELFAELYLEEIKNIDILLTWLKGESLLENHSCFNTKKTGLYIFDCEPYFYQNPWTSSLEGKKILVIHPFERSIQYQYQRRQLLFAKTVLPDFELKTIKAVQSISGNKTDFASWFKALDFMKNKIDECDFDIALIAAGSYGLPLAAHIKRKGKIGIHLGGFLQLIFGIKGRRWDSSPVHRSIMNEYWKSPFPEEYPINYKKLDHGSYW